MILSNDPRVSLSLIAYEQFLTAFITFVPRQRISPFVLFTTYVADIFAAVSLMFTASLLIPGVI